MGVETATVTYAFGDGDENESSFSYPTKTLSILTPGILLYFEVLFEDYILSPSAFFFLMSFFISFLFLFFILQVDVFLFLPLLYLKLSIPR